MRRAGGQVAVGAVVLVAAWLALGGAAGAAPEPATVVDDFTHIDAWTAEASEGAQVWIAQEPGPHGMSLRIDYDLGHGQGWVIVHRAVALTLPTNFALTFGLLGEGPRNTFELKLVDPSKRDVWWWRQRDLVWPTSWQRTTVRRSRLELAWGAPGAKLGKVAAVEFAITPGQGGSGSVWIDDLTLEPRPVPAHEVQHPTATATTTIEGREPDRMFDDSGVGWHSADGPEEQELLVDFDQSSEFGGLIVDWDADDFAVAYDVEVSTDGAHWTLLHSTTHGDGGRDYLYLPDSEARYLKLRFHRSSRGHGYGIRRLEVPPIPFSSSPNHFFEQVATDERPGLYPKYLTGKQTYWTIVGVEGDGKEGLVNEEGAIEVDRGAFSLEPFLWTGDQLVTWADVQPTPSLDDGYLPIPSVTWRHEAATLKVTAFAGGEAGRSYLYARYRVENTSGRRLAGRLFVAIRPYQVLPPWQALNMVGGVSPIHEIRYDSGVVRVNREKAVVALTPPDAFGASAFEEGEAVSGLVAGRVPEQTAVTDPTGFASGVLAWNVDLAPGDATEAFVVVPFHEPYVAQFLDVGRRARTLVNAAQAATKHRWQTVLSRVDIDLPAAPELVRILRTTLAYILIDRDGAALQPGARNYARAWIRDGAAISLALLEMGFPSEVADFLRWYAAQQMPDGKIPCCIDPRGADPTPEHDSDGEFLWAVSEYYRYTRDVGLVADLWPNIVAAVDYLASLRAKRTTDGYRQEATAAYFGLLPESISHEGYSSRPVHSYWDDFWALGGLEAAPTLASVVGDFDRVDAFTALRDGFQADLVASITKTMAMHGIDYVPGSVELGDFDPTSTAIGVRLLADDPRLRPAFERTFDRYTAELAGRMLGADWESYSPYEVRNVEALVALGRRDDALSLLDWLVRDQRPPAWHEWAEVSYRDPTTPRFIGDMPHGWIGAIYVRVLRSLLVRERGRSLVIGAGVPPAWVDRGITVRRLPTPYGIVNFNLRSEGANAIRLRLGGDLVVPSEGVVLASPRSTPIRGVTIDGRPLSTFTADAVTIDRCPADVVVRYE